MMKQRGLAQDNVMGRDSTQQKRTSLVQRQTKGAKGKRTSGTLPLLILTTVLEGVITQLSSQAGSATGATEVMT